jgi:carbamate kinase
MGPKIGAVCRFVEATGRSAAIGQLSDAQALLTGDAGTFISMTGDALPPDHAHQAVSGRDFGL